MRAEDLQAGLPEDFCDQDLLEWADLLEDEGRVEASEYVRRLRELKPREFGGVIMLTKPDVTDSWSWYAKSYDAGWVMEQGCGLREELFEALDGQLETSGYKGKYYRSAKEAKEALRRAIHLCYGVRGLSPDPEAEAKS